MNKVLFWVRNILFIFVSIFFITIMFKTSALGSLLYLLFYPLFFTLLVISTIQFIKKNKHINFNNLYNISFISAMIYILFVILRSLFDNAIIIKALSMDASGISCFNAIFLASNLIYIIIVIIGLIIYNFVLNADQ